MEKRVDPDSAQTRWKEARLSRVALSQVLTKQESPCDVMNVLTNNLEQASHSIPTEPNLCKNFNVKLASQLVLNYARDTQSVAL